jgi:uncharacterized protein YabE (DUF348 family)
MMQEPVGAVPTGEPNANATMAFSTGSAAPGFAPEAPAGSHPYDTPYDPMRSAPGHGMPPRGPEMPGGAGMPGPGGPARPGVPQAGTRPPGGRPPGRKRNKSSLLDRVPRSPLFLALYAAVALVVVAGGGTFFALHHSYTVSIDGKTREVSSFSGTVNGVLSSADVKVGGDDIVWPSSSAAVGSGDTIVVRHARPLTITMDGKTRTVMTTALTVNEALEQLRLGNSAVVNASRSRSLPTTGGFSLQLRGPKRVIILLDQVRLETETTATSVAGVLQESGIKLGKHDHVSTKLSSAPKQDMVLKVAQLISKPATKTVHVKPPVKKKKDPTMTVGDKKTVDPGKSGLKQVVTAFVMERGHKVRKVIATTWKRHPEPKIVKVGTKAASGPSAPSGGGGPVPSGSPQAIAKSLLPSWGWSDQFGCLDSLWNKESHWNVHAANPSGAYGIPQSLPGSKMASAGPNWQNNAETQIKWGLGYIKDRYGSPCSAWSHSESSGWY